MNVIKNVCVFCGSSSEVKDTYKDAARMLGRLCAAQGWGVIYGGARIGLMGLVAEAALSEDGAVTGVIPEFLKPREIAHEGLTVLHTTKTMHERQNLMGNMAEAFVILPGGLGTLAEFFEVLTWKILALHTKPIVLVNIDGYWNRLISLIDGTIDEGFLSAAARGLFAVVSDVDEAMQVLTYTKE